VLVTTSITKEVRKAFFEAFFGGPGVLLVGGVAGTGKTETCKDICNMLGMSASVINASSELPHDAAHWGRVAEQADVIIIDEANRIQKEVIEAAVCYARNAHVPLCLTCNPKYAGAVIDLDEVLGGHCARVQTLIPPYPIILSSMLASEGLQQADELGDRLHGLFDSLKEGCTKQPYYDWGLRKLKAVTTIAGKVARAGSFTDERQMVTTAVQTACSTSITPLDESVFVRSLIAHFGADAFVPMPLPNDFWNAAAAKITRTVSVRHASLCLPVLESEETFMLAVTEQEAERVGADVVSMPGTMASMSAEELFGEFIHGQWKDGCFTQALRSIVSRDRPGWLVAFCGTSQLGSEKWEPLNSLMDDNKCLHLANGESIRLRPDDRIVFAAPNMDASPATISRLGIINVDAHHRQRL